MPSEGFANRLRRAWRHAEDARDYRRISQADFAQLVSDALGREKPLSQTAVSRWLKGAVPDVDVIEAVAAVCRVRAGWLAFAEEPMQLPEDYMAGLTHTPISTPPVSREEARAMFETHTPSAPSAKAANGGGRTGGGGGTRPAKRRPGGK